MRGIDEAHQGAIVVGLDGSILGSTGKTCLAGVISFRQSVGPGHAQSFLHVSHRMTPERIASRVDQAVDLWRRKPHLRSEIGWVVVHKLGELVLAFAALKIFTNLMPQAVFGEFSICLGTLFLIANLTTIPIYHAYARHFHGGRADGSAHSATLSTMRWYGIFTIGAALIGLAISRTVGEHLGLESHTILAGGLIFLATQWRNIWVYTLEMSRRRRRCAMHQLGFQSLQVFLVCGGVVLLGASATVALLSYALAAGTFAVIGFFGLLAELRTLPDDRAGNFGNLIVTFGLPIGCLLTFQWLQTNVERYVLGIQLDLESVATYVASYQIAGMLFMLTLSIVNSLLVPIAYQRVQNTLDPDQLYAADKVLILGAIMFVCVGFITLVVYGMFGPAILRLLTSTSYVLPTTTILLLTASRFAATLAIYSHAFFKVHQQLRSLFLYSIIAGAVAFPISWYCVGAYGIHGAALSAMGVSTFYLGMLVFAPGGCISLVSRGAQRDGGDRIHMRAED